MTNENQNNASQNQPANQTTQPNQFNDGNDMNGQQPMNNQSQSQGQTYQNQMQQNMYQGQNNQGVYNQQGMNNQAYQEMNQNPNMQWQSNMNQQGQYNPNMNAQQPVNNHGQYQGQAYQGQMQPNMYQGQNYQGLYNQQAFQGMNQNMNMQGSSNMNQQAQFNPNMQQPMTNYPKEKFSVKLKNLWMKHKNNKKAWAIVAAAVVLLGSAGGYGYYTRFSRAINNHEFEVVDDETHKVSEILKHTDNKYIVSFKNDRMRTYYIEDGKKTETGSPTKYQIKGNKLIIGKTKSTITKSGDNIRIKPPKTSTYLELHRYK